VSTQTAPRAPEALTDRDRWRQALNTHLERKARTRALRDELAAVRSFAKRRRHADRLARLTRSSAARRAPR
jgi:hypothetical protein